MDAGSWDPQFYISVYQFLIKRFGRKAIISSTTSDLIGDTSKLMDLWKLVCDLP